MKTFQACAIIIACCAIASTISIALFLREIVEIERNAAENGRYIPTDVRNRHYASDGVRIDASSIPTYFDTRTGKEWRWDGKPSVPTRH